ncbi:MAG: hypothetical protein ISS66_22345 [Desulfobacteraceae bacterium]|nr:hypothetical protein [Desulfobacteraceae bacterium]
MVQRRHGDLDIGVPITDVGLVVVLVEAEVLAGVSGQALTWAEDTGEALVGVELTLHGEYGSITV